MKIGKTLKKIGQSWDKRVRDDTAWFDMMRAKRGTGHFGFPVLSGYDARDTRERLLPDSYAARKDKVPQKEKNMPRTRKYLEEQPQEKKLPWGYDTLEEIKKEDAWAKKLVGEVGSIALYNSSDNPNARNPEGGKLEWYPAGEYYNPGRKASDILTNMGLENIGYHRPAIEVFDKDVATQPDRLKSALRLDMLHYFTENKFLDKNKNFKDIIGKLEATVTDKESLRKEKKNPGHIRRVEVSGLLRGAYNNLSDDRLGPMAGRARMWREHPGYHVYTKKQRKLINQFKEELDKWSEKPIDKNADKARDRDKYKVYKTP